MTKDRPLGLPEGSVRAILAIGITIGAFVLFMYKKNFEVSSFLSLVGLPIGLYFGQYITPAGGGAVGQVGEAVKSALDPVTDLAKHTVNTLAQVPGAAAAAVNGVATNGAAGPAAVQKTVVDVTDKATNGLSTVGNIVLGGAPAISGSGIFPS